MTRHLPNRRQQATPAWAGLLLFAILWPWAILQANPSGEILTSGSASFNRAGNTLTINQSTARAIIHWNDFSIAAGETTHFVQPSSQSAVLNRVVTANPSAIYGNLQANGQVYLVNPNGILVGAGAQIQTGSFIASTLDVDDAEFMSAGNMTFSGNSTAMLQVDGTITATEGDVILIAREVSNSGNLHAANGTVAMGAGSEVLLAQEIDGQRIYIKAGEGQIVNNGLIEAARAELRAAGGNPYALAINHSGTVRATGIAEKDGAIWLVASQGETQVDGSLIANRGDIGGDIRALGEIVTLTGNARLLATGDLGGGTIYVGGGYQGSHPDIMNATFTNVAEGAYLDASARTDGHGGTVILWADDTTTFAGSIDAKGGSDAGNGGFVEVSGKLSFDFTGVVDLRAENGDSGTLLLDPTTLEIVTGGADAFPLGAGATQISPATLLAQLALGNLTLTATTSITFTNDVIAGAANTNNLILDAGAGSIFINTATLDIKGGDLTFSSAVTVNAATTEIIANKITNTKSITGGAAASQLILSADDMDIQQTIDYTGKTLTLRPRSAGVKIDLGTRTDTNGDSQLNLSNVEIMKLKANTLEIGRTNASHIYISQKIAPSNINNIHLITGGNILKGTPSAVPFDLNTWGTRGISGGVNGTWTVGGGGTNVVQSVNAETPTFFISNDTTGYVGVIFEGQLSVSPSTDDDYIGFVFGVKEPTADGDNQFDFYVFDWSQKNQNGTNKFMLARVVDAHNTGTHDGNILWTRADKTAADGAGYVDMLQTANNNGWADDNTVYDFRITYDKDRIKTEVKGGAFGAAYTTIIDYANPDPVNSPFQSGDFGFYNFSQDNSTYSNFKLTESPSIDFNTGNLAITAGGSVTLNEKIDVANIAINAGGAVSFKDDNGFNISTVAGVSGINANGNNIKLESLGNVTQSAAIQGNGVELTGSTGNFTLTNSSNAFTTLAANTGNINIREDSGFDIGTVGTTTGITTSGNTTLSSTATVTQSQRIVASGLSLNGTGGIYNLTNAANDIDTLAGSTGTVNLTDADGLSIGTVNGTNGLTATGNTTLTAGGAVTQTQAINTDGIVLLGNGSYTLTNTGNQISKIAANTTDINVLSTKTLTVDSVNATTGISVTGTATLQTKGATSDIILNKSITADSDNNAAATDSTIVLNAEDDFHNNVGAAALNPGQGRWLIYSEHPDQSTFNGLTADPFYGKTYAANAPATIGPASSNRLLYSYTPTITIGANNVQRFYGDTNPGLSYQVSGLVGTDTITQVLSGSPTLSTAAVQTTNTGSYTINTGIGTLAANFGYNVNVAPGTLTIAKAPLVATANNATFTYGDPTPTLSFSYSGFKLGENSSVLDTAPTVYTNAPTSNAFGTYSILFNNGSDNNYDFSYVTALYKILTANIGDYTLIEDEGTVKIFRENTGTNEEFNASQPPAMWPPKEFPVRFAERGQDDVNTTTVWLTEQAQTDSQENAYDVTSQNFIHENFKVVFRDRSGGFKTAFEDSGKTYQLNILSQANYHEFLDREHTLEDATLLSDILQ